MSLFSRTPEQKLNAEFLKGGHVCLVSQKREREVIHARAIAELLRHFSRRSGEKFCESFTLQGFYVKDELNLHGAGLEGSPILPMRFVDCEMPDGVNVEEAFLKGLVVENFAHEPPSSNPAPDHENKFGPLSARGVTILNELQLNIPHELKSIRIDLSHSRLKGGVRLQQVRLRCSDAAMSPFSFVNAVITGDLLLEGIQIKAGGEHAFDGDNLVITGGFKIGHFRDAGLPQRSSMYGTLQLRNVKVGGQFVLEGVKLTATDPQNERLSLMAEDAEIGGDLCFYDENHPNDSKRPTAVQCLVEGQVNLMGAHVHGDLRVFGSFQSTGNRIRAFKAERIHVDGDMHFGWIPGGKGLTRCSINGECDFSNATVAGEVIFSGSTHELSRGELTKTVRRRRGVAVNLRGATIGGDLRCEGSVDQECRVEGLSTIGATIKGRLLLRGADLIAYTDDGENRKAITANGSTIRGGIFIEKDQFTDRFSVIKGGFRLRNSTVNGPVIFSGVTIHAEQVAFWASNTHFGTDVIFKAWWQKGREVRRTEIRGELRFLGATVDGTLYLQGVSALGSNKSGAVLDCYTAEIKKGVVIEAYSSETEKKPGVEKIASKYFSSQIDGIISLNFAHAQSLRFGTGPLQKGAKKYRWVQLRGALLLQNVQLHGAAEIANVSMCPASCIVNRDIRTAAEKRLRDLGVFRDHCIIHARYANLGARLYVRLRENSRGLINLYGARAGTIGGFSGKASFETVAAKSAWAAHTGELRSSERSAYTPAKAVDPLRENWGKPLFPVLAKARGKPRESREAELEVLLNMDEFTYERVNDYDEMPECLRWDLRKYWYLLLGRPTPQQLKPRVEWLQRQVENPHTQSPVIISPYRQLAVVYRDMGDLKRSYAFIRERRWLQIRFGKISFLHKLIEGSFSLCFGFGYSPTRALVTVLALAMSSILFVHLAVNAPAPNAESQMETTDASGQDIDARIASNEIRLHLTGNTETPVKWINCRGILCPVPGTTHNGCHVPQRSEHWYSGWSDYNVWTEGLKVIYPLTRFETGSGCVLHPDSHWPYRLVLALIQGLSWILFPLAAITLTGVLREKDP